MQLSRQHLGRRYPERPVRKNTQKTSGHSPGVQPPAPRQNSRKRIRKFRLVVYLLALCLAVYLGKNVFNLLATWTSRVDYDLAVIGAEPEGVAAAVSAARSGLSVLLVDAHAEPGGRMIQSKTGCLRPEYGPDGTVLSQGLFLELYREVQGDACDRQAIQEALKKMLLAEESLLWLPGRHVVDVQVRRNRVVSITLDDGRRLRAARFIDAMPGAPLALQAGAVFSRGGEEIQHERAIPVSLVMEIAGLDWEVLFSSLDPGFPQSRENAPGESASGESAPKESTPGDPADDPLAREETAPQEKEQDFTARMPDLLGRDELLFAETMSRYQALDPQIDVPGLKLIKQRNGTALLEAIYIYDVNPLDRESRAAAWTRGEREAELLIRFLRQNVPGFEEAFLAVLAPQVHVRETRHLQSLYRLSLEDILEHRFFWDKIALSSSPAYDPGAPPGSGERVLGDPYLYSVPLRSLVPERLTNLLVVGPSTGYTFLAWGSAAQLPLGFNVAQAAGQAAALSLEEEVDFHVFCQDEVLVAQLQERLREQGAYLRHFSIPYPLQGHPSYPALRELRSWGLLHGGYENDYRLEEPLPVVELDEILQAYLERVFPGGYRLSRVREIYSQATVDDMLDAFLHVKGLDLQASEIEELLGRDDFIPGRFLQRGEAFSLLVDFVGMLGES